MEHRQHPRFRVEFHSSFSSANVVSGEGNVNNLSIRGCRVCSMTDVRPGTTLQLRVDIPHGTSPLQIKQAVVRWHRDSSFGMEFVSVSPDDWVKLQHLVKRLELEPYQRHNLDDDRPPGSG